MSFDPEGGGSKLLRNLGTPYTMWYTSLDDGSRNSYRWKKVRFNTCAFVCISRNKIRIIKNFQA
jgi:hypothetical protein